MMRLMALLAITSLVLGKFQGKYSEGEIEWEAFPNHVDHDFTYHREFLLRSRKVGKDLPRLESTTHMPTSIMALSVGELSFSIALLLPRIVRVLSF